MILIDYKDRRPIYEQIIERFQQMILCGALQAGEAMPSVRSLAMELAINPNTIQRAYQELEREGYIYTMKGKGSFVSDSKVAVLSWRNELQLEVRSLVEKALAAGVSGQELAAMLASCVEDVKGQFMHPGQNTIPHKVEPKGGWKTGFEQTSGETERQGE